MCATSNARDCNVTFYTVCSSETDIMRRSTGTSTPTFSGHYDTRHDKTIAVDGSLQIYLYMH